ncbi:MAG: ABC transporter ATP-binding protein [Victivallales bacterium]|nr:ABC transporter ATP-binding protein [Victivallales bacterium]
MGRLAKSLQLHLPQRYRRLMEAYRPGSKEARLANAGRANAAAHHGPGGRMSAPLQRAGSPWQSFLRVVAVAGEHRMWIALVFALVSFGAVLSVVQPVFIRRAVDCIANGAKTGEGLPGGLLRELSFLVVCYALGALLSFLQGWLGSRLAQSVLMALRNRLCRHLLQLPLSYLDRMTTGEILSRATNDVELVSNMLSRGLVQFFGNALMMVCAVGAMLWLSPMLTLVTLLVIPLCVLVSRVMARNIRACFLSQQTILGLLNSHIEETASSLRVVKAFNHEASALEDFRALNQEMRRVGILARAMGGCVGPMMNLMSNLGYAVLVGVGGWLASRGSITVGVIAAFIQYSRHFMRPAMDIANQYNDIQSALAGAERVFEVLEQPPEEDAGKTCLPRPVRGELDFENIDFQYKEGEPVLHGFTLHVAPGRKVALVGTTGSGKTTIVSLLMRFYEVAHGKIRLDGVPLRDIPRADLRTSIAMVLQDTWLFSGTVRENIRYGRLEATDEQVEAAARTVGADHFISRLPQGYDTPLTDNGGNLSQGQRQLLCIARAVLADPPVLILDEATSSIDTRTELLVQRAMIHLMKGRTCIVIAHRLSTIRDADTILVLEQGRIAEQGSREELLAAKGAYWRLEQSQNTGATQ